MRSAAAALIFSAVVMALPAAAPGTTLEGKTADEFKSEVQALAPVSSCQWLGENRDESVFGVESFELGDGKTLYIVNCIRGAYQGSSLVLLRDTYELKYLPFPEYSEEYGWGASLEIGYDGFDPSSKLLTTYVKFRGLGDCGSAATYRWQDYAFKLMEYRYLGKCGTEVPDEIPEWPVIYKAN